MHDSTMSLLAMINRTIPRYLVNKDTGALVCYSLVIRNYTRIIRKKCTSVLQPVSKCILKISYFLVIFTSYSPSRRKDGRAYINRPA